MAREIVVVCYSVVSLFKANKDSHPSLTPSFFHSLAHIPRIQNKKTPQNEKIRLPTSPINGTISLSERIRPGTDKLKQNEKDSYLRETDQNTKEDVYD